MANVNPYGWASSNFLSQKNQVASAGGSYTGRSKRVREHFKKAVTNRLGKPSANNIMVIYAEEVQRFQNALNNTVNEVDKAYLRELQANSHECAALCCRDMKSPTETLRQCVENCGQELQNAQRIVLQEFDRLEDRFERCLSSCGEFVRDSRMGDSNHAEDASIYDGCVRRCVDSNIEYIPDLLKAINRAFKKS